MCRSHRSGSSRTISHSGPGGRTWFLGSTTTTGQRRGMPASSLVMSTVLPVPECPNDVTFWPGKNVNCRRPVLALLVSLGAVKDEVGDTLQHLYLFAEV